MTAMNGNYDKAGPVIIRVPKPKSKYARSDFLTLDFWLNKKLEKGREEGTDCSSGVQVTEP